MAATPIKHAGEVIGVEGNKVIVRMVVNSACSGCHAKAVCGVDESKDKIVEVVTLAASEYAVGDSVEVAVSFTSVGVEDVEAIEAVVYGANGCIVIKTEAPAMITVYDMMGGIVSRLETEGDIRIEDLQRGIYIVRVNDKTQKVLVK